MTEQINLKEIEKKAWTSYFQDGLWDILLGLILLNFGIAPFIEEITGVNYLVGYIIILFLAEIIFFAGKKYITIPRMGKVKFSNIRRTKRLKVSIVLGISVLLGFIIFLLTVTKNIPVISEIPLGALVFGINAIIVFSAMAYLLDFPRLYLYGIFFAASIVLVEFSYNYVGANYDNLIGFGLFGGIITIIGLAYLYRFLKKYPLPNQELN